MSTDITPPDQDPPKKRKQRSKKGANTDEDEHKRNKFLERNRLAASKCREKKKLYTQELEGTKINLEARNVSLQREYSNLLTEVSDLKHQLMVHAKCNDRNIDLWLENEARRFVQTSDAFGQPFAGLGQPGQTSGLPEVPVSPKSRHASIASNFPTMPGVQLGVLRPGAEGPGGGGGGGGGGLTYASDLFSPPGGASGSYSNINPPGMKREPDINYDHMPDDMFSDQSTFGSG
jgi:cyclic AMP-dependent transcription factor ATF-2